MRLKNVRIGEVIILVFVFAIFIILISFSTALVAKGNLNLNKVDKKVLIDLQMKDKTEVIIELNGSNNLEKVASNIQNGKVRRIYKYSNTFSAELNKEDLDRLVKDNNVISIKKIRIMKALLQDSVGIINASSLWDRKVSGINLTGTGETICVIDTGVNYTHPDLGGCYGNNNLSSNCKVIGGYDYVNNDANPMDDHGHGTHVAGITAANGSINGVAKNARIVALKVLDSSGNGVDANIIAGIEWCVSNSTKFNISAISISIGTDCDTQPEYCYSNYCNDDPIAPSINAAAAKNITVVIASGNDGNSVKISTPACVENATAIGASDKSDNLASYTNRNSLVKLLAPGSSINSTYLNGYSILSGTSMATPHAAGAAALINQFLRINGKTRTAKQIESLLNNTGKIIYDSSSNRNYTRINVYNAVNSLSFNNVNLLAPADGLITKNNQSFSCNASSLLNLVNVSLYLWNSSGLENYSTTSLSGLNNGSNFSYNFTHNDNYKWNCLFYNNGSFNLMADQNYSISFDNISPGITVILPVNNSWNNAGRFNVSLNENGTCQYFLNTGINVSMNSSDNRNFTGINNTLIQDGNYNLTYYCNDSVGNINSSSLIFKIDLTSPNVSIINPAEGYSATGTTSILFEYNVSDNLNLTSCSLILNSINVASNSTSILNITNNISYSVGPGNYSWQVNCTDEAGNIGNSSSRSMTINSPSSSSSGGSGGGSGGGGSSSRSFSASSDQVDSGYQGSFGTGDSVKLSVSSSDGVQSGIGNGGSRKIENHTLTVNYVGKNYVNLTIRSEPIKLSLLIGESARVNIDLEDYLLIKLEGISGNKANLTIKKFYEPVKNVNETENKGTATNNIENNNEKSLFNKTELIYLVLFLVSLFIIISSLLREKRKKKRKRKLISWHTYC